MGIYIKNINIPTEQEYIDIRIHADGTATMPIGKHPYYRQLEITRVPTPHGKLIDANAHKETLDYYIREAGWSEEINMALGWVKDDFIDAEPVVIEAEE